MFYKQAKNPSIGFVIDKQTSLQKNNAHNAL